MKYLYKQTGMIVESSIALDSAILNENEKEEKPQKKTPARRKKVQ